MSNIHFIDLPDDFPPRSGPAGNGDMPKTSWDWLSRGKTLGKSVVLQVSGLSDFNERRGKINILELRGDDRYALPLSVTIAPPLILPSNATVVAGQEQNASGFISIADRLAAGAPNLDIPNILLDIQWGIGGGSHSVEVDVLHGLCVNLQASWVRAYAFYEGGVFEDQAYYQLSAFVGPGQPSTRAQRTHFLGILPVNVATAARTVPKFSKNVILTGSNGVDVFVGTIRFYRDTNGTSPVGEYLFASNSSNNLPVPIPNGGYFYRVTPAIDLAFTSAVFELAV